MKTRRPTPSRRRLGEDERNPGRDGDELVSALLPAGRADCRCLPLQTLHQWVQAGPLAEAELPRAAPHILTQAIRKFKSHEVQRMMGHRHITTPNATSTARKGDDRNRTGVDGFAVRRKAVLSAYLSGFRRPQMPSAALKKRSVGESLGRDSLTCCPQGPSTYSPLPSTSACVQIVRSARVCGHIGCIGRNGLCQRCVTREMCRVPPTRCHALRCRTKVPAAHLFGSMFASPCPQSREVAHRQRLATAIGVPC
jgi:hypothetical protein